MPTSDTQVWRIRSATEHDEYDHAPLYWNRDRNCWGLFQFSTAFSATEQATYRVPEGGFWEWAAWGVEAPEHRGN